MNAKDRATVRASLNQATLELAAARQITSWWHELGPDVRRQYQEFEMLAGRLYRLANGAWRPGPEGFVPEP